MNKFDKHLQSWWNIRKRGHSKHVQAAIKSFDYELYIPAINHLNHIITNAINNADSDLGPDIHIVRVNLYRNTKTTWGGNKIVANHKHGAECVVATRQNGIKTELSTKGVTIENPLFERLDNI